MKNDNLFGVLEYARCWNNLDVTFISNILDENCIYESQWVLLPLNGRDNIIKYLEAKFLHIKATWGAETIIISAEIATHPNFDNAPMIVLTQVTNELTRKVSILIQTKNKKITRIDICFIPDPLMANLTGNVPT